MKMWIFTKKEAINATQITWVEQETLQGTTIVHMSDGHAVAVDIDFDRFLKMLNHQYEINT